MRMATVTLADQHLEHLQASAIDADIIEARGYRTVTGKVGLLELEPHFTKAQQRAPGLVFPIYRLGNPEPYAYVLRPDNPRTSTSGQGKTIKYEWPTGVQACFDVLPMFKERLDNPKDDLWITEGAKKADALASLGVVAINLNGVWAWRGKNVQGGRMALPDFEHVAWNGRRVILAFDSDFEFNAQVMLAMRRLAAVINARGANVDMLHLPHYGGKS